MPPAPGSEMGGTLSHPALATFRRCASNEASNTMKEGCLMTLRNLVATIFGVLALSGFISSAPAGAQAGMEAFHGGPVFPDFGKIASVDSQFPIPEGTVFKMVLDVSEASKPGGLNRTFESAARFINMHVDAGVPLENISVAVVVHGGAALDVTQNSFYQAKRESDNPNAALIGALTSEDVQIYLCGQSAAYAGISNTNLLAGVTMARSAMTAHALLQQGGYTLNPF